jgi:hypothetical protein
MASEGLGDLFEADCADTYAGKFLLMSIGGGVESLTCARAGHALRSDQQLQMKRFTTETGIVLWPFIVIGHRSKLPINKPGLSSAKLRLQLACQLRLSSL